MVFGVQPVQASGHHRNNRSRASSRLSRAAASRPYVVGLLMPTVATKRSSPGSNVPLKNDRRWVRDLFKPGRIPRAVPGYSRNPSRSRTAISSSKEELFLAATISWPGRPSSPAALRSLKLAFQTVSSLPKCGSKRRNRTVPTCVTRLNASQNLVSLSIDCSLFAILAQAKFAKQRLIVVNNSRGST